MGRSRRWTVAEEVGQQVEECLEQLNQSMIVVQHVIANSTDVRRLEERRMSQGLRLTFQAAAVACFCGERVWSEEACLEAVGLML